MQSVVHILLSVLALVERLRTVRGLAVTPAPKSELHPMPMMPKTLGHLVTPDGHGYRLAVDPAQGDAALAVLNRMVEAYGAWGNVERTLGVELGVLTEQYRDLAGLVNFFKIRAKRARRG